MTDSTIAALATAPAPAGVAVIRVSGPQTQEALRQLFRSKDNPVDTPRKLLYGKLIDHKSGKTIDHALAVYMPNPFSFTGEDVAEFQFHGSPLIAQKVLRSLFAFGITPAEPGEFSKRAFLNGKLDLVQAEAIADLIEASSEKALQLASEQLSGSLSKAIDSIGEPLRDLLAELEAQIDFPEEDIHPDQLSKIRDGLSVTLTTVQKLLGTHSYGATVREGFRVLLCGAPNAGKSSLLNKLLGKERAIVTEISGTTRDLIEESMTTKGLQFLFCDSAGITNTEDKVEQIGIELARGKVPWADLLLFVVDGGEPDLDWQAALKSLQAEHKQVWMVVNKIDRHPEAIGAIFCDSTICRQNFYISAQSGAGLDGLRDALVEEVLSSLSDSAQSTEVVTRERHKLCLTRAEEALKHCLKSVDENQPLEIVSADLRIALSALEEIVGKTYTEDILGRIFSKFCIGK